MQLGNFLPDFLFRGAAAHDPPVNIVVAHLYQPGTGFHSQIHALFVRHPAAGDDIELVRREFLRNRFFGLGPDPLHIGEIVDRHHLVRMLRAEFPELLLQRIGYCNDLFRFAVSDLVVVLPAHGAVVVKHQILPCADSPDCSLRCPVTVDDTGVEVFTLHLLPDVADVEPVLDPLDGRHRPHHGFMKLGGILGFLRQVIEPCIAIGFPEADSIMAVHHQ